MCVRNFRLPTDTELSSIIPVLEQEKYDDFLPLELLSQGYGSRNFNILQATEWVRELMDDKCPSPTAVGK
ncbi:hypothetical protein DI392_06280 [Vibrio albus]|jgi:hypothetical protein|uniref:Uncharacterized protein n=1 Tax=Vibrio albus TaxID=2200953 RepID=A0A2U3BAJ9_9VIBR|nr:hypothetical protein [Vibrio albus]PWI33807.1 hypothetical protein DI392_06280 [Vibrio albus]